MWNLDLSTGPFRYAYISHLIFDDPAITRQVKMKFRYAAGNPAQRGQHDIELRF